MVLYPCSGIVAEALGKDPIVTVTSSPSAPRSEEDQGMPPPSYADAVERLFAEFAHRSSLTDIADTVTECRAQLSGAPAPALPELIERLARQRLITRG